MAKRGRPPKPSRLRLIEGNRSRTPILPEPVPKGKPTKPRGMSKHAKSFWEHTVTRLVDLGIATDLDQRCLEEMANWFDVYKRAMSCVQKGEWEKQPAANTAFTRFEKLASKFGLTPSDRVALKGVGNAKDESVAKKFLA